MASERAPVLRRCGALAPAPAPQPLPLPRVLPALPRRPHCDPLRGPLLSIGPLESVQPPLARPRRARRLPSGRWIRALLAREGLDGADGEVWLQAFPRVLGYVFNPVSFWLCHDRDGALRAVLCEVNNTFGEHHNYLVAHPDQRPIQPAMSVDRAQGVPRLAVLRGGGALPLSLRLDARGCAMRIDYDDADGPLLPTALRGEGRALTRAACCAPSCSIRG